MAKSALIFAVEIPARIGQVPVSFYAYENFHLMDDFCISVPHNHQDYEVLYTEQGGGTQTVDGRFYPHGVGDALFLRPGEYHYQPPATLLSGTRRYSFRFDLPPCKETASAGEKRAHRALERALGNCRILHDGEGVLLAPLKRLEREITERRAGYYGYVQAECMVFFTELLRLSGEDISAVFPTEEVRYGVYFRNQIERFLRWRYAERLTLADLAETLQVSTRQASRLVQNAFGLTFVQKLTQMRIEQAKYLLKDESVPLERVAADCGFQSYSYFSAAFRRAVGIPPGEYRKSIRTG